MLKHFSLDRFDAFSQNITLSPVQHLRHRYTCTITSWYMQYLHNEYSNAFIPNCKVSDKVVNEYCTTRNVDRRYMLIKTRYHDADDPCINYATAIL
eukprot:IDg3072t1